MNIRFDTCFGRRHLAAAAFATFTLLAAGYPRAGLARPSGQKTFSSAEEATGALIAAVQNHDDQTLTKILGAGKALTTLDDEVQNKVDRELFVQKYQQMHRLVAEPDGTTVLYMGAENWPFPVPLVSTNGAWHFDSAAGAEEVLFRRIGENEAAAIEICHALVQAQKQRKTTPGGHDSVSLQPDQVRSGYYFRILTGQPNDAPGVAKNVSHRKMTDGFAVVAYPAVYRSSGVMTFIVNQGDVVYEKDLGPKTAKLARAMTEYTPDSTWNAAE